MAIQSGASEGLRELSLFAGAGGGILGGKLLGWRTVCAVERDAYAAQVLAQRQNDGHLEPFPIWSDVTSFDGKPWRGIVDVVSAGFPCQDLSAARTNNGGKQLGLDGEKSGLWREVKRIVGEAMPIRVALENSPRLVPGGINRVLRDLAEMGFDAEWGCVSASTAGAPHERDRVWIMATHPDRAQREGGELSGRTNQEYAHAWRCSWWKDQPTVHRVDDGLAHRVDRLKAIGNGQVPIVAATAWEVLTA